MGLGVPPVVLPDSYTLTGGVTVHEASCWLEPCISILPPSSTRPPGASGLAELGKHRFGKFTGDLPAVPRG